MVREDPGKVLAILAELERLEDERQTEVPQGVISTGLPSLDAALVVKGIPRGHITHCCGDNYAGKTVALCHVAESVTSTNGSVVVADLDRSFHFKYMKDIGVDINNIEFIRTREIQTITRTLEICVEHGVDLFILDSLAALPAIPSLDTREVGRIQDIIHGSRTAVIISNQNRVGKHGMCPCYAEIMDMISPITFYLKTHHHVVSDGQIVGHYVNAHVVKNRFSPATFIPRLRLIYGSGFDKADSLLELMILDGRVQRAGSWYYYDGEPYQGREELRRCLENELRPFARA